MSIFNQVCTDGIKPNKFDTHVNIATEIICAMAKDADELLERGTSDGDATLDSVGGGKAMKLLNQLDHCCPYLTSNIIFEGADDHQVTKRSVKPENLDEEKY